MYIRKRIHSHETGLWFRNGELRRVLQPGTHWVRISDQVEIYNRLKTRFEHSLLDVLVQDESLRKQLMVVDLKDTQRALVYRGERLFLMLGPGRYAFWNEPLPLIVETFDVGELRFVHPNLKQILAWPDASKFLQAIRTESHEKVLIYRDGELVDVFGPGTFAYWRGAGNVTFESVDMREQVLDVAGQEIMTGDKVTLRLNLLVTHRVTDPLASVTVVDNSSQAIYREAQLALRAAVGGRTLEKLLTDKQVVSTEVRQAVARRAGEFGVEVVGVGVRDVILPGDMKTILNQVIEAQKQAEANLIRRREETAAARSQANTAKLLAENPVLQRMRELEILQDILAGTKATFLLGRGDIAEQVKTMLRTESAD